MLGAVAVFLITLGVGQLVAAHWGLRAASLVGPNRWIGSGAGLLFLGLGMLLLPLALPVLLWAPVVGPLAVAVLLLGGAYIFPPSHPDGLFASNHPAHGGCWPVQIPDGDDLMPAFWLLPPDNGSVARAAVAIIPGAGDNKVWFKWRLVRTLLGRGLAVLTIDPPGHGDYRHRPLAYPACRSAVGAAVRFMREQPGIERVGLVGISLGGALALDALAAQEKVGSPWVDGLVVLETPTHLNYSDTLFYRELWNTLQGAPVLSLLREISLKQVIDSWHTGGYRSLHPLAELFELLNPVESIGQLRGLPLLLVYSQRDRVASPEQARAMWQAAPHASFLMAERASHVTLSLIPEVNREIATWLQLNFRSD